MLKNKLTFAEYRQIPKVNISSLLQIETSPKQFKHAMNSPHRDSAAMRIGRAAHTAVLEPLQFLEEYTLRPDRFPDWKTLASRQWRDSQKKQVLTNVEYELAKNMAAAVHSHELARTLLRDGNAEVTIEWSDPSTDLGCKGRLDWIAPNAIVDLKTTRHALRTDFPRHAAKLSYHTRLAWYQHGLAIATNSEPLPVFIIAVQSEAPFDVVVFRVPDAALEAGRERFQRLLSLLAECVATDHWPGIAPDEAVDLELPPWAIKTEADNDPIITLGGQALAL